MTDIRPRSIRRSDRWRRQAGTPPHALFVLGGLDEVDAYRVAIDPGELAAPISQPGRRQQQEEFLQVQPFHRTIDGELGAGLRNIFHGAVAAPGAVDSHHMRVDAAFEGDSLALAAFCDHDAFLSTRRPPAAQGRTLRSRLEPGWLTGCKPSNR